MHVVEYMKLDKLICMLGIAKKDSSIILTFKINA